MRTHCWCFAIVSLCLLSVGPVAGADMLYNNGGFVTGTGTGFNGANISQAAAPGATLGWTASFRDSPTQGPFDFRVADDFTVGGEGWRINEIDVYGYLTFLGGSTFPPASYITGATLNIWDANPGAAGAQIVATSSNLLSTDWTGAYRVRSGDANLSNTERPIMSATVGFNNVLIGPGNYWLDIFYTGLTPGGVTTVFSPIVMGTDAGGKPIAINGNAYQYEKPGGVVGWNQLTGSAADGAGQTFAIPFEIRGTAVPEPSSLVMAGIGLAGAATWSAVRRRAGAR
jgi:hypothetical protein